MYTVHSNFRGNMYVFICIHRKKRQFIYTKMLRIVFPGGHYSGICSQVLCFIQLTYIFDNKTHIHTHTPLFIFNSHRPLFYFHDPEQILSVILNIWIKITAQGGKGKEKILVTFRYKMTYFCNYYIQIQTNPKNSTYLTVKIFPPPARNKPRFGGPKAHMSWGRNYL